MVERYARYHPECEVGAVTVSSNYDACTGISWLALLACNKGCLGTQTLCIQENSGLCRSSWEQLCAAVEGSYRGRGVGRLHPTSFVLNIVLFWISLCFVSYFNLHYRCVNIREEV